MKQENRFVAQLFHFLAPFVNADKELYICVDGAAAAKNSNAKNALLLDSDLPDLWLTFCGNDNPTGIEAKIMDGCSISIRQAQLKAWCTDGMRAYQPTFWVTANRELSEFCCWHHLVMRPRLDKTRNKSENVSLSLKGYAPSPPW